MPLFEFHARCWRWDCKGCGPGRRKEAYKVVKSGCLDAMRKYPKTVAVRFITITYPNERDLQLENPGDLAIAKADFRKFIQNLRRHHGRNIEYVVVSEPTKRGRIHLHAELAGPAFIRKCSDGGRRHHGLPTGPGSGSPCYCTPERPCIQRLAWDQGMGWVKIEALRSAHKGAAYLAKYLAKGAGGFTWPRYARRLSKSNEWGSLTFEALRRQFIEEVRALRRRQGEPADLPPGELVFTLVPHGEQPLGVNRRTGELMLPSRLR